MKLSIKEINFKNLLINHAEKVVFGLVAVIALVILSPAGTSWTGFDKQPEEFKEAVERGEVTLAQNNWPQEKAKEYNNREDVRTQVGALIPQEDHKPVIISKMLDTIGYLQNFDPSIFEQAEPNEEPVLPTFEDPIADFGRMVMALAPDTTEGLKGAESTDPDSKEEKGEPDDGEFRIKKSVSGLQAGAEEGVMPVEEQGMLAEGGESGGELLPPVNAGKGERFISIRMIFPLRKLYKSIAKASHKTIPEIKYDVIFTDFQLQRMEAIAGPNPWAGKWEDVDIEFANSVLDKAADYDSDGLDFSIAELFTMPLPMRLMGSWTKWASHPRIENYHLSPQALKDQEKLKAKLAKYDKKIEDAKKDVIEIKIKGFGPRTRNFGQLSDGLVQSGQQGMMMEEMEQDFNKSGFGQGRRFDRNKVEDQLSASRHFLLFRYLDFDIKPGKVYRYRARVELKNPNFNLPIEAVKHPAVAEGLYRTTEWSKSTSPVAVPPDVNLFVDNVYTPLNKPDNPTARFEIFDWKAEFGTVVHKQIEFSPGEFLSKKVTAYVLKPGAGTFEKEEVTLGPAEEVLVDIDNESYVRSNYQKKILSDLKLDGSQNNIGAVEQVLVVDKYGRLVSRNATSDKAGRKRDLTRINRRDEANKDLKDAMKKATESMEDDPDGLAESAGLGEEMEAEDRGRNRKRSRRRRNINRITPAGR